VLTLTCTTLKPHHNRWRCSWATNLQALKKLSVCLASPQYRTKEVAARAGFSDSHYIKRQTRMTASEYHAQDPNFG
jgi:hypothetical protein